MKTVLLLSALVFVWSAQGQQLNSIEWDEQAKANIRLLPKYGRQQKTDEQKKADERFINETLELEQYNGERRAASNHLIQLGFIYLNNGDIKTSMYRFNEAYLLDSTNSDIYLGYGAVYMAIGDYQKALQQYREGITANPKNTHLLTDYGTYFMKLYSTLVSMSVNDLVKNSKEKAIINLDSALKYLNKSFLLDPKDKNTAHKLSTSYYYKDDCHNAWKFYDVCKALGGQSITEEYSRELKKKCKRGK